MSYVFIDFSVFTMLYATISYNIYPNFIIIPTKEVYIL